MLISSLRMAELISINTEVANISTKTMVLEAIMHLGVIPIVRVTIPPGEVKDLCHGDLPTLESNPDRPVLLSAFVEGAAEEEKLYILPTLIKDHARLVLNYKNGMVTVTPVEGNIMARIRCIIKLKRTMTGIWEHMWGK